MTKEQQIRERLKELAANVGPVQSILATVQSVNEVDATCVLLDEELELFDVRLKPVINANQALIIYPKINTWVLAVRIEDEAEWMVVSVDEADKMVLVCDDTRIEIKEGLLIKRGEDTLKEALTLMIEAVQKIMVLQGNNPDYAKLIQAQDKVNNILN